ncbi:MAG TPA: hypothetical protein VLL48_04605 [Longimicrobiales bacterium]|nr:hypothetical protein [Longimicrobiales bacterium]
MRIDGIVLLAAMALARGAEAQDDGATYVVLEPDEEVALARSAAPADVSAEATVWLLRDGEYEVAVEGTNGNHCFVARSQPRSLEPVCYDEEASATVLLWEFAYHRLRFAGYSDEEREAELARAVGSGEIPTPRRPAMSYMMSSEQHLFDPESGRDAGRWKPHIMLYVPHLTTEAMGLSAGQPWIQVARAGTPLAHLVVVVPDFVDPVFD